jgi:hypothetical protein
MLQCAEGGLILADGRIICLSHPFLDREPCSKRARELADGKSVGFGKFERGGMAGLIQGLGVGPRGKCSKKLPHRNEGKLANAEAAGRACTAINFLRPYARGLGQRISSSGF